MNKTMTAASLAFALGTALTIAATPAAAEDKMSDKEKCFGVAMKGRAIPPATAPSPPNANDLSMVRRVTCGTTLFTSSDVDNDWLVSSMSLPFRINDSL